jgi:hypothetical protein
MAKLMGKVTKAMNLSPHKSVNKKPAKNSRKAQYRPTTEECHSENPISNITHTHLRKTLQYIS